MLPNPQPYRPSASGENTSAENIRRNDVAVTSYPPLTPEQRDVIMLAFAGQFPRPKSATKPSELPRAA